MKRRSILRYIEIGEESTMKLESVTIENYRQFENAKLTFDDGVTILAGANNSGKTSLIHLIKRVADYYTKRVD